MSVSRNRKSTRYAVVATVLVFLICFTISSETKAQSMVSVQENTIRFISKLILENRLDDALYYIDHLHFGSNKLQNDSIVYLKAFCIFETRQHKTNRCEEAPHKERICLSDKSLILNMYDYLQSYRYDSLIALESTLPNLPITALLRSSAYLLKYDSTTSLSILRNKSLEDTTLSPQRKRLDLLCHQLPEPKKSAWVAGLLSAAIPGLGKIYAGQKREGWSILYTLLPLGGLVAENIYRSGVKSPQTICFGGIFSIFYIGNIIGSIYSPQASYHNQHEKFRKNIISNLYQPIHTICCP